MFFRRKKKDPERSIETEWIEFTFPLYVSVYKSGCCEENDDEPIELEREEAYNYLSANDIEAICQDFSYSEIHNYFEQKGILYGLRMQLKKEGMTIICANVAKGISDSKRDEIYQFLEGQMSDGWGECFSNDFYDEEQPEKGTYSVSFWKYNG